MKKVLGYMRRAAERFNLLENGDRIAIGISGGKDSMLLAHAMSQYKRYMQLDYELVGITIDLGFEGFNTDPIAEYAEKLGIEYHVIKTDIGSIVFDERKEKNPCALCSRMRKAALYRSAKELGCNKAAFAHHADDLIETLLMSLIYEGRISTFAPVTYLTRQDITLIRPFILVDERDIIGAVRRLDPPICKNPCKADGVTSRQDTKELIKSLIPRNKNIKKCLLTAIENTEQYRLWDDLALTPVKEGAALVANKNCKGDVLDYALKISAADAAKLGFVDENGVPLPLEIDDNGIHAK